MSAVVSAAAAGTTAAGAAAEAGAATAAAAPGEAGAAAEGVFHLQLRRFPHSAQAFNLSGDQLSGLLTAWAAGRTVEVGEHHWEPAQTSITILRGTQLEPSQLAMGRGWTAARRGGEDATQELLAQFAEQAAQLPADTRAATVAPELARQVLALCAAGPVGLREAWRLAAEQRPECYAGEQLLAAGHALHQLVQAGLVALAWAPREIGAEAGAEAEEVLGAGVRDALLRDWATWSGAGSREVVVAATPAGLRAASAPAPADGVQAGAAEAGGTP